MSPKPTSLILEEGAVYRGEAFGAGRHAICHFERSREIQGATRQGHMAQYHVYIMTNATRTLYTSVTNDLERRVYEHKRKLVDGFTKKYNVTWLAYYEVTSDVSAALTRDKQLKRWGRSKKVALIESLNPQWKDLAQDWYDE